MSPFPFLTLASIFIILTIVKTLKKSVKKLVGNSLPVLNTNTNAEKVAVLKDPMGSSGTGVFFVSNAEEIHEVSSYQVEYILDFVCMRIHVLL